MTTREKQLVKLLKSSIKTQKSMLKTLKELGDKAGSDSISLRMVLNKYRKYLEVLEKAVKGDLDE
jgi:hypothetical protein